MRSVLKRQKLVAANYAFSILWSLFLEHGVALLGIAGQLVWNGLWIDVPAAGVLANIVAPSPDFGRGNDCCPADCMGRKVGVGM